MLKAKWNEEFPPQKKTQYQKSSTLCGSRKFSNQILGVPPLTRVTGANGFSMIIHGRAVTKVQVCQLGHDRTVATWKRPQSRSSLALDLLWKNKLLPAVVGTQAFPTYIKPDLPPSRDSYKDKIAKCIWKHFLNLSFFLTKFFFKKCGRQFQDHSFFEWYLLGFRAYPTSTRVPEGTAGSKELSDKAGVTSSGAQRAKQVTSMSETTRCRSKKGWGDNLETIYYPV